jgi:hypothetical protein
MIRLDANGKDWVKQFNLFHFLNIQDRSYEGAGLFILS